MLTDALKKLMRGEDLSTDEAKHVMAEIMTGQAGEVRTAALLTALACKGETGAEVGAFARSMRKAAVAWPGEKLPVLADTCGTGGDSSSTLNISTLSAILLASMGIKIAKHGNRAVSSKSGSADLLEGMGIRLDLEPERIARCVDKVGICFLFAQKWHPAMKHAGPVRKAMGVRTVFNLLGPLTNPAPVNYQILGLFSAKFMEPVASALAGLGRKGAYVVHSDDGLDEVSIAAPTAYTKVKDGQVVDSGKFEPADFGLAEHSVDELRIASRDEALERSREILEGKGKDAENAIIVINAALLHSLVNDDLDLKQSAEACMEALKAGKGAGLVADWVSFAQGSGSVVSMGD